MSKRRLPDDSFSTEFPRAMGRPANAALVSKGIMSLDQVAAMTEPELLELHGMGPKAVRILKAELEASGRSLSI